MPTKKPRLLVTMTEEQHALLMEYGRLQGRSASSFLRDLLDASTPLLRQSVPALRMASEELDTRKGDIDRAMRDLTAQARSLGDEAMDQLELLDQLQRDGRRRPSSGATSRSEGARAGTAADASGD